MKIMLIHPFIRVKDKDTYLSEPLGLMYLSSYIETVFGSEVDIQLLDLYALGAENPKLLNDFYVLGVNDEKEISEYIEKYNPNLIGITCNFTAYFQDSLFLAKIIKNSFPSTPIVMGGVHR